MPTLIAEEIEITLVRLRNRIKERFPEAGLGKTCDSLIDIAKDIHKTVKWINSPNYYVRVFAWVAIAILIFLVVKSCAFLQITLSGINLADVFQMIDSAFNTFILIGAAGIFLMSSEIRRKRKRVLKAVNNLRCIAHIVDAHQLTKDPHSIIAERTLNSPERKMTEFELGRYLDYCTEMLSLISKLAFLYVQEFTDPVAQEAVNDLEDLTNGLSQKIWQKIMMLNNKSVISQ